MHYENSTLNNDDNVVRKQTESDLAGTYTSSRFGQMTASRSCHCATVASKPWVRK